MTTFDLKRHVRTIPDFPSPGIRFRDLTPLLGDGAAFRQTIDALVARYRDARIDKVAGIEARGFIFGTPIAHALGAGFVPVRKPGKLPYASIAHDYALEYGTNRVEMHTDAVMHGERVLVVDDLLATGGTAGAALSLLGRLEATVVGCAFVVELIGLGGRAAIEQRGHDVFALSTYTLDEA